MACSEPRLIELAYAFEQATKPRVPPPLSFRSRLIRLTFAHTAGLDRRLPPFSPRVPASGKLTATCRSGRLRARLVVAIGALVVCLTGATLAYVGRLANQAVAERVTADLRPQSRGAHGGAGRALSAAGAGRAAAGVVSQLMALMGTDAATVRDFLADYRERNARDELLLAFDASGTVVARSDTFAAAGRCPMRGRRGSSRRCRGSRPSASSTWKDTPVHTWRSFPAEAGGTIFGFVAAAAPVDDRWAAALRDAGGKEIVVLGPNIVAGTTLAQGRAPWRRTADLPVTTTVLDVELGERFEAVSIGDPHA